MRYLEIDEEEVGKFVESLHESLSDEVVAEIEGAVEKLVKEADTNNIDTLQKPLAAMLYLWDMICWSTGLRQAIAEELDDPPLSLEIRQKVVAAVARNARVKISFQD